MSRGLPPGTGLGALSVSVATSLALAGAAVAALGRPDLASVDDFLTSGVPTYEGALATTQVVVWVLVALLVIAQLISALRRHRGQGLDGRSRRPRSRAALVIGLLIFAGGIVHHQAPDSSICCGDLARADSLLR